jgi:hypothetical protein
MESWCCTATAIRLRRGLIENHPPVIVARQLAHDHVALLVAGEILAVPAATDAGVLVLEGDELAGVGHDGSFEFADLGVGAHVDFFL